MIRRSLLLLVLSLTFSSFSQKELGWIDTTAIRKNKVKSLQIVVEDDSLETYFYDRNGYLIASTEWSMQHMGLPDKHEALKVYLNDSRGKLMQVSHYMSKDTTLAPFYRIKYHYDKIGNLVAQTYFTANPVDTGIRMELGPGHLDGILYSYLLQGKERNEIYDLDGNKISKRQVKDAENYIELIIENDVAKMETHRDGILQSAMSYHIDDKGRYTEFSFKYKLARLNYIYLFYYDERDLLMKKEKMDSVTGTTQTIHFHYSYYP